jgi:nitrite reductase (NADH) small subunit
VDVCGIDELAPGERRIVSTPRGEVGLFNIGGKIYALKNRCPHNGAAVCLGSVSGTVIEDEQGEFVWGMQDEVLRCPWHQWEFDIETGHSLTRPKYRIAVFKASVVNDRVILDV